MAIPFIGGIIDTISSVVDKLVPDKGQAAEFKHEIAMSLVNSDMAQMDINKEEAKHPSIFVAGWRPAVGWVCVIALGGQFVIFPIMDWMCAIWWPDVVAPSLEMHELMTLLMGLLGMGTLRTFDKTQGTARHKI